MVDVGIQPPPYQLFQVLHDLNVMYILGAPHIIDTELQWDEQETSLACNSKHRKRCPICQHNSRLVTSWQRKACTMVQS